MKELVSVVVPIYNVEKYLDRCVDSIVNQTYQNLEIILVDDGAKDSCPLLCDWWAARDQRIKVIHKQNAGLGMARNTGIENATGQYICFFDSDDYVDPRTIELSLELAKKEKAELVVYGMASVDRNGNVLNRSVPRSEKNSYRGNEILEDFLPSVLSPSFPAAKTKNLILSAWSCLIMMEPIRRGGWRFVSEREIISEDIYSLLALYKHIGVVAVLRESLYYYCENDSSLTHSYRADRFVRNKCFYQRCLELCDLCGYPPVVKESCASPFLGNTIGAMKQEVAFHYSKREAINALRKIIDDELLQAALKSKKKDPTKWGARALLWAMRQRAYYLSYLILSVKIQKKIKGNTQ